MWICENHLGILSEDVLIIYVARWLCSAFGASSDTAPPTVARHLRYVCVYMAINAIARHVGSVQTSQA
jgi:hypothetical protein